MNVHTAVRRYEHHFHAMGTEAGAWLWCNNQQQARAALMQVQAYFARVEARLSRFRPGSELSRMNRSAGAPFSASPMLFALVTQALAWRDATDGLFDPTILRALEASGYDRSFAEVAPEQAARGPAAATPAAGADVLLGPGRTIRLPANVGIDLGGIAKGWAAQVAAQHLGMWGAALVDAGGDIATGGIPRQEAWVVTVAHPLEAGKEIAVVPLHNQAIATSSRAARRWQVDGVAAHHLIDPRTGAPAQNNVLSVTAVGRRLPDVEIHAKVALILGEDEGAAYLSRLDSVAALITSEDGRSVMTGGFGEQAYVSTSRFAERFRAA